MEELEKITKNTKDVLLETKVKMTHTLVFSITGGHPKTKLELSSGRQVPCSLGFPH